MSLFTWTERYAVGVERFDEQHKILFDLVGQFHDCYAAGKGRDYLRPVLDVLLEYTESHFADEEEAMRAHGYPAFPEHLAEHQRLRDSVHAFDHMFRARPAEFNFLEFIGFMNMWLQYHVLVTDMAFKDFFRAKGLS